MLAAALRSILNAPPSIVWGSNTRDFYKSKAFVTPDASTIPPLESFMALVFGSTDLGGVTLNHKPETNYSSPDLFGIHPVEGRWVLNDGGISAYPMDAAPVTVDGVCQPLPSQSPSTSSDLSSDQSSIFSNRDAATSITTNTTSPDTNIHAYCVLGWPRPITPFVRRDVVSFRLTGEKSFDCPSVVSATSSTRMKAIAGWVTGFIYAQIDEGTSAEGGVVGTYNADVHIRVADRIRTLLELTSLPLPTVFLALWYISHFPFAISAADGNSPRDIFCRLLCGYGTVHVENTIFLAFIAGAMLANKANDDFPLSVGEWHHASLYEIKDLNFLEVSALKLFSWNIAIDSARWGQWMAYVTAHHSVLARYQAISQDYGIIACLIDRVNRHDPHWNCDCDRQCTIDNSSLFSFDGLTDDSPRSSPYFTRCGVDPIIHRSSQTIRDVAPSLDRAPAPWCPAADPIVESVKPARTMGTAPGSTWIEPVTALDIQENITARRYPLLPLTNRYYFAEAANAGSPSSYGTIGRV